MPRQDALPHRLPRLWADAQLHQPGTRRLERRVAFQSCWLAAGARVPDAGPVPSLFTGDASSARPATVGDLRLRAHRRADRELAHAPTLLRIARIRKKP